MTRRSGGFRGAKPTWTTTSTSGIFGMEDVVDLKAANQWPRGPVAPTSLAGTGGDQQVALTWTAPATTHGTITDYLVEYTPAAGSPTVVATGSTSASYTLTGLTNDTEYTIRVAAVNHTRGDWSSSVAVTPTAVVPGWDLSTASYVQDFSVLSQDATPVAVAFNDDGTKMYIVGLSGLDINEYALSTAWDISTASYTQNFSLSSREPSPRGVAFKPDGTRMYIVGEGDDEVNEFALSTAWNISTASYTRNFSVAAEDINPQCIAFKTDGTKMYIAGQSGQDVNEYSLSTAWDISTASYTQNFSVFNEERSPHGIFFKPDGTKMFIVGETSPRYSGGSLVSFAGRDVNEYDLATPWDVSTAVHVQNFDAKSQDNEPSGLAFKPDGTKMFIVGRGNDKVYEYSL